MTVDRRFTAATDHLYRIRSIIAGAALIGGTALLLVAPTSAQAVPLPPATMNVVCDPSVVVTGNPTTCTVTVSSVFGAATPAGVITIPSDTGLGLFSPPSCRLVSRVGSHTASCTVVYRPLGPGSNTRTDVITFAYSGDANYPATSTTVSEGVVAKQSTYPVVACRTPLYGQYTTTIPEGQPSICSIDIEGSVPTNEVGTIPNPTGTITIAGSGGPVTPTTCTLGQSTFPAPLIAPHQGCSFNYTPQGAGSPTRVDAITVTYQGDSWYTPTTGAEPLSVIAP